MKIIYLAAWHFYASYRFDYSYFIKLCHDHGIAVYAWFEFPQVTPLFWEEHPEWREKTATGKGRPLPLAAPDESRRPGSPGGRRLRFSGTCCSTHDWDGVNLAELNFDTNKGMADPDKFTPMNADVREEFRGEGGLRSRRSVLAGLAALLEEKPGGRGRLPPLPERPRPGIARGCSWTKSSG